MPVSIRFAPQAGRRSAEIGRRRSAGIVDAGAHVGELRADIDRWLVTLALLGMSNVAAMWYGAEPGVKTERIAAQFVQQLLERMAPLAERHGSRR